MKKRLLQQRDNERRAVETRALAIAAESFYEQQRLRLREGSDPTIDVPDLDYEDYGAQGYAQEDILDDFEDELLDAIVVVNPVTTIAYGGAIEDLPMLANLATVGVHPIVEGHVEPVVTPHMRNFTVFAAYEAWQIDGELLQHVEVPSMGCESLTKKGKAVLSWKLDKSIVSVVANPQNIVYGMREKLDGEEAVNIVLTMQSGRQMGIMFESARVYRTTILCPSVYEQIGDDYYLLTESYEGIGTHGINILPHPWLGVTKANVESLEGTEGMILLIDGVETRVKRENSVTLDVSKYSEKGYDRQGREYNVIGRIEESGNHDLVKRGDLWEVQKVRNDKVWPDSTAMVQLVEDSLETFASVAKCIPHAKSDYEVAYEVVARQSDLDYRIQNYFDVRSPSAYMRQASRVKEVSRSSYLRWTLHEYGRVDFQTLRKVSKVGGYFVGQAYKRVAPPLSRRMVTVVRGNWLITDRPLKDTIKWSIFPLERARTIVPRDRLPDYRRTINGIATYVFYFSHREETGMRILLRRAAREPWLI